MKKNIILIVALAVVTALVAYFYANKQNKSITLDGADFAISDTSTVNRIFISDTYGNRIDLQKKDGKWVLNDSIDPRLAPIQLILKVFNDINIQSPVDINREKVVIKRLATEHKKVEIYQGDGAPSKVWYIGDPTDDNYGTYMLLEQDGDKAEHVFITGLPWHHGYITPMFFTDLAEWSNTLLFQIPLNVISNVSLTNYREKEGSFEISNSSAGFKLADGNKATVNQFDTLMVKDYLSQYQKIAFETIDKYLTPVQQDSLIHSQPIYLLKVLEKNGKNHEVKVYLKPQFKRVIDNVGYELEDQPEVDLNRYYALIDNKKLVLVQRYTWDNILSDLRVFKR